MKLAEELGLEVAFREHYGGLVRTAYLLTGDMGMAEDLVQEAFVRAVRHLPDVTADHTGAYLRRTVLNLWKNTIRRSVLERRHVPVVLAGTIQSADDASARVDMLKVLRSLSSRQRACVVLRFYEELSETQVAQLLGMSVGSVKKHTARAMVKLREELGDG